MYVCVFVYIYMSKEFLNIFSFIIFHYVNVFNGCTLDGYLHFF